MLLLLRRDHFRLRIPSIRGRSEGGLIKLFIIGTAPCRARRRVVVVLNSGLGSRLDRDRLGLVTGFLGKGAREENLKGNQKVLSERTS